MASEYKCTQFTEALPEPGTNEAENSAVSIFITTIVQSYRPYHYYLLTPIVVFAIFANILIVVVLSHKEMRNSGVNITMMLIALCDFGCSLTGVTQLFLGTSM
ncbi:hypothetical protein GCK72_017999 [Caenorhabditis remanei]|uniref:G-protein coupled receptors family 1 profile domain-containing protein n=1 Tax=Caenorhabditis remanei TaxID=31234 RepID=A0A6A5GA08_CAERE|nr:hypothetical protein GCK72_017999 [Caenorhabditis remanei]KAF1751445.1 hypothetical protein GCK72_017999 [Caenorhabditis remanei]